MPDESIPRRRRRCQNLRFLGSVSPAPAGLDFRIRTPPPQNCLGQPPKKKMQVGNKDADQNTSQQSKSHLQGPPSPRNGTS